jgi:two-component system NtrC family sensor kinase
MKKIAKTPVKNSSDNKMELISTIGDLCKVCYTCVRDCPAKAIKIVNGQAEVVAERCIGCGNCVKVCSQNAKQYHNSILDVRKKLLSDKKKAAIIAPSFPAEFTEFSHETLVGMLRECGFDMVCEVAFGADIVSTEYRKLLKDNPGKSFLGTTCPGIVAYVEKYHPSLIECMAPIVSPMVATAKALRFLHGENMEIVFIGPCIAKKAEAARDDNKFVDAALTFSELRTLFKENGITPQKAGKSKFDEPQPGLGALFALSGGILQAADMKEDLLNANIICADGKNNFVEALEEFEKGSFKPKLLELLCCKGCIGGAGMSKDTSSFTRRNAISEYVNKNLIKGMTEKGEDFQKQYDEILDNIDMSTNFADDDHRLPAPSKNEIKEILNKMGKFLPEDELDCEACGYKTCREHAVAIHKGLAESEMCLPYTIDRLKKSLSDLNVSNDQLEQTRQALFNAEKLASMGQLSAGIAHEINNPLGVILLNSKIMLDYLDKESEDYEDIELIVEQAERCKKIVSGLLDFARKNKVILQPANIVEHLNQCLKSIIKNENIEITLNTEKIEDPEVEIDKDQMAQVITNLVVNASEAMQPEGGRIHIETYDVEDELTLIVEDTGPGIPDEYRNKIFEPLFTTKQIGKGTGLGLAVTYGIIKMHHGQIKVETNTDKEKGPTGTKFIMTIPRKGETKEWDTMTE